MSVVLVVLDVVDEAVTDTIDGSDVVVALSALLAVVVWEVPMDGTVFVESSDVAVAFAVSVAALAADTPDLVFVAAASFVVEVDDVSQ